MIFLNGIGSFKQVNSSDILFLKFYNWGNFRHSHEKFNIFVFIKISVFKLEN